MVFSLEYIRKIVFSSCCGKIFILLREKTKIFFFMGKRKSDLRGLHNNRKNADNTKEIWKGDRFMKKMKKLLFMVVFATAATVFVGCGNKEGSSEEMTVDRTEQTTQKGEDKENLMSPGDFGENPGNR